MSQTLTLPGLPEPIATAVRRSAGEGRQTVYVVGGYLRDRLLGRPTLDVDLAVAGEPRAVARRLAAALEAHVFPLSHEHGAWRVSPRTEDAGSGHFDITQLRGSIEEDLHARDFTFNAMAMAPEGGVVIDPLGGAGDIAGRTVRLASDEAVRADPLRALRAVRFAVELRFALDDRSAALIARDAGLILRSAGERQRDEIARVLDTSRAALGIRLIDRLGLLDHMLPELVPAKGCVQPKEHHWDVFDHSVETVAVLDCILSDEALDATCERKRSTMHETWPPEETDSGRWSAQVAEGRTRRANLKLIGLLHDVSKPETRTVQPDGRVRFFGHPERGAEVAGEVFRRLKFSAREVKAAELLVREHLRPGQLAAPGEQPSPRALYRLFRDLGDLTPDLLALNLADGAAAAGPGQQPAHWQAHVAYTGWILRQRSERRELVKPRRLVTGHDLIADLGMEAGPELGRVLNELVEAEAAGEISSRDQALELARALLDGRSPASI